MSSGASSDATATVNNAISKQKTWLLDFTVPSNCSLVLLPSRKSLADRPEFTADPAYQGFLKSFPFSMVSPYLAYAGWGGKIDSEGVPLFQQALVGKLTAKEFLDKFAEVLTKNMT